MITNADITRITEKLKLFGATDWAMGEDTARLINELRGEQLLSYSACARNLDGDKGIELYFCHNLPHGASIDLATIFPPDDPALLADILNTNETKAQDIINYLDK